MRHVEFNGIAPKYKQQSTKYAITAHNCDIYSGELRPYNYPVERHKLVDTNGQTLTTPATTIYDAGGIFVGFPEHTWVIPDTVGALEFKRFLFVTNSKLYWQCAENLIAKIPPVLVGTAQPCVAPSATLLAGLGCIDNDAPIDCGGPDDSPACDFNPSMLASYVYTHVRYYPGCAWRFEESAPSPAALVDVPRGDAVALSATKPAGVSAVRFYREIAGDKGTVYLFAGESTTGAFVDDLCINELGEPLMTQWYYPPPDCIQGVAVVGDNVTLVWNETSVWGSEPNMPHAWHTDRDILKIPYGVVGIVGATQRVEGRETYLAHVLTHGKTYSIEGQTPEKLGVTETQDWYPCISKASIAVMRGGVGYASPYGYVVFSGSSVTNLTDNYMTDVEWLQINPHDMRAVWHNERLFMSWPDRDGYVMCVEEEGGQRPKTLVTHGVRAYGWFARADSKLMLTLDSSLWEWGAGAPMWYKWQSSYEVQTGKWTPSTMKVVGVFEERRRNNEDLHMARMMATKELDDKFPIMVDQIVKQNAFIARVYRDGKLVYTHCYRNSGPVRLPRLTRGLEWSISVEGFTPVREIHMQTSVIDLSQEGGMA